MSYLYEYFKWWSRMEALMFQYYLWWAEITGKKIIFKKGKTK